MRIASLVPSATEMLFALGLGENVVGVTHECDHPTRAASLPHLTRSVIPAGLGPREVDAAVRERTAAGRALYELDEPRLAELAPDLIVTQAVCEVCAVSYDDVVAAAARLPSEARVISLDPTTLDEVLADLPRLAAAAGVSEAGRRIARDAERRMGAVRNAVADAPRPRVAALEWIDPVFAGGHWVPEMVERAGGHDVLGVAGEKSRTVAREQLAAARPRIVVAMPCGYDTGRAAKEALEHPELFALGARVAAVNASAYFSRPGPRLVDGIELLGHLLHPQLVPAPPPGRCAWLDSPRGCEAR